ANNHSFLHSAGIDSETLLKQVLTLDNHSNLYGNFNEMLNVELPNAAMMPMMMPLTPKAWRSQVTLESEDSFAEVQIARKPSSDPPWAQMKPADFQAKRADMKKSDTNPNDFGALISDLPTPDEEPIPGREE